MRGVENSTSHLIAQYSQLLTKQGDVWRQAADIMSG
jgi:hypothetical protein